MIRTPASLNAALLIAAVAASASGQVTTWTNPGTGDFLSSVNWSAGVPGPGNQAFVINGGTLQVINAATDSFQTMSLGTNSGGAVGYLELINGELNGYYVQVGHHGYGELTMSGASTINAGFIRLAGNLPGAEGVMTIHDGDINIVADFTTAWYGTGTVYQYGGDITCSQIIGGNLSVSNSTYIMEGGTIFAGLITLGSSGTGSFTQSGTAQVETPTLYIGGNNGVSGSYTLEGGTLTANLIKRTTAGGSYDFTMLGGRLAANAFGQTFAPFDLTVGGGTLAPGDINFGVTTIHGDWTQGPASNLEIDAQSSSVDDAVVVNGRVTLSGKLTLNLTAAPTLGQTHLIINNDDADPVVGIFYGLTEGATVTGSFGGTDYNFAISYVGGDGNDVVLNACFGDGTGDGVIDFDDMNIVLSNWGNTGVAIPGDLDGNGVVDFDDLNLVLGAWGASCV